MIFVWRRQLLAAETTALPNSASGAPIAHTAAGTTRADVLRPYFGARWGEALPHFAEAGFDLQEPFDPELVPPWGEVRTRLQFSSFVDDTDLEAHRKNAVAWNDNLPFEEVDFASELYDPRKRPLGADDLAAIRVIKERYEPLLLDMGSESGALFWNAMEKVWTEGRLESYPLVALDPIESDTRQVRALRMVNMSNWTVMLVLRKGESVEYEDALTRIGELKAERLTEARNYLSGR
ncbi:MAG: hypothetical protein ACKVWV_03625 [Planctomycetota bacterium]